MFVGPALEITSDYIHLVGWPALLLIAWRLRGTVDAYMKAQSADREMLKKAEAAAVETKGVVDLIATNHMVHLQKGIDRLGEKTDDGNQILTDISKGIAILVDRNRPA